MFKYISDAQTHLLLPTSFYPSKEWTARCPEEPAYLDTQAQSPWIQMPVFFCN